jgi:hypothetical protein
MKQAFLTALFALISFSVFANPDAPISSADQQIADLKNQLEIAKLKAEIAKASATPSAPIPTVVINNNLTEKTNSDNVTQPAPAAQAPVVVIAPSQAPAPVVAVSPGRNFAPGEMPSNNNDLNWTYKVWQAYTCHNSNFITSYTMDGQVNYFNHAHSLDQYIIADMANDNRRYGRAHNTYDLESFLHEVSNEYSAHWNGPMIYDSITVYQEVWDRNGTYHHANIRFTVGYTMPENRIYAMVLKVL